MSEQKSFFLVTPLGLEDLQIFELENIWQSLSQHSHDSLPPLQKIKGGIELQTSLELGLSLNFYLKIPTRILLRLDQFKCRDLPKLYNRLQKTPWNQYLKGQAPQFEISAHKSRLFHDEKIKKTAGEAIQNYYRANPLKKIYLEEASSLPSPTIYLRFENDLCTVSIDTSGDRLHKRQYRINTGLAPIRENIAAALLWSLKKNHPLENIPAHLIDPMCGAGTFLAEAFLLYQTCPHRDYAFIHFPCTEKSVISSKQLFPSSLQYAQNFLGYDINSKVVEQSKENLKSIHFPIENIKEKDLFAIEKKTFAGKTWVICNPPYGERIDIKENLQEYFQKILQAIYQNFKPDIIGIILPSTIRTSELCHKLPLKQDKNSPPLTFSNGGIKVQFATFLPRT